MAERVVLAYSGGLDTSVGIGWLHDATGKDVVALAVDVGQGGEDMEDIRQRALDCGAVEAIVVDAKDEFASDFLMPALKANALYQKRYPLVSALSRPVIAKHLAITAKKLGADSVAHGCTGKGNDQVRFEAAVAALAPELKSIAPVRDLALTRDKAIVYAEEHNLPIRQSAKNPYSIDKNVWGRAVETGFLEDPWNAPIEDLYEYTMDPSVAKDADEVTIHFESGIPTAIDGVAMSPLKIIEKMNELAGKHGVGRIDVVEDRLVGIKSREVYEAPAAIALIAAHEALESLTLERDLGRYKRGVESEWANLVYDGLWYSGLKRSLDVFIDDTQKYVSGDIRLTLAGRPRRGHGAEERAEPVRLRPRHLRHRRHLRPVALQGLHRDLVAAEQDLRAPRPAGLDMAGTGEGSLWGARFASGPAPRTRPAEPLDPVRLGARALRHRGVARARQGPRRGWLPHARGGGDARRARRAVTRRVDDRRPRRRAADEDVHGAPRGRADRVGRPGARRQAARRAQPQRPDRHAHPDVPARPFARDKRARGRPHRRDKRAGREGRGSDPSRAHPPPARAAGAARPSPARARVAVGPRA